MFISRVSRCLFFAVAVMVLLSACSSEESETQEVTGMVDDAALGLGVELSNMDQQVRPQDDFFRYVNGGWLSTNTIPSDRSRWGSFDELREQAEAQVLDIVREAAEEGAEQGSEVQKMGDMYQAFMDEQRIESLGLQPLRPLLDEVDALQDYEALTAYWATAPAKRITAPVSFAVGQDQGQSDQYITSISQSGLGLPDRDYYLNDDARFRELRAQYLQHIANMMTLAGHEAPEQIARHVLDVETRIAQVQWTRVQNRDRNATYNRMAVQGLAELAPGIGWSDYLAASGLPAVDNLVVRQPDYVQALSAFYRDIPMAAWRDYHRYHVFRQNAQWLPSAYVEEHFDFFGRILRDQPEMRSREKRAVAAVEAVLGFAVGRRYVERHFQPEARERMDTLVRNLLAAFEVAINELEWMTPETKQQAQDKLAKLNTKIAYPSVWEDYSCLQVDPADLLGNIMRSRQCEFERMAGRLGQVVDRDEWFMTPQTVNAYYNPTMNEIVFPAAILQPPFFNVEADDAINYGAIGAVIGHEITHAFDDQGRRSDGDGNLRDWWAEEDERQFQQRADLMVQQFDTYEPVEGMHIQGALTLGENMADLGGLTVAFQAWQRSLNGQPAADIEGFSGAQRFFLGWGQIWRATSREEAQRQQLMTDPHSPGEYRVFGTLANMPEFYQAFGVEVGDAMYRDENARVKIW